MIPRILSQDKNICVHIRDMGSSDVTIPLSDDDIKRYLRILGGIRNPKVYIYRDLCDHNSLESLGLDVDNPVVILYETSLNFGHWIILIMREGERQPIVEHFDSYGYKPDQEIAFVPENFRVESGQSVPHLSRLLYKSGHQIAYNAVPLQSEADNVSTCGRWCVLRGIMRDYSVERFRDGIMRVGKKFNMTPDEVVCTVLSDALPPIGWRG